MTSRIRICFFNFFNFKKLHARLILWMTFLWEIVTKKDHWKCIKKVERLKDARKPIIIWNHQNTCEDMRNLSKTFNNRFGKKIFRKTEGFPRFFPEELQDTFEFLLLTKLFYNICFYIIRKVLWKCSINFEIRLFIEIYWGEPHPNDYASLLILIG